MNKIIKSILIITLFIFCMTNANASSNIQLNKVTIDLNNKQSLQRGAKIFFNYCQGCHGLKYMRYITLADEIGLTKTNDKSIEIVIQETLMHATKNINENNLVTGSISKDNGIKWFGKTPPDLSLISRYRGNDWLYTYFQTFYKDTSRPFGVNNLLFPDVGMPHILIKLQGVQILKEHVSHTNNPDNMLDLIENGDLSKNEYNNLIKDLVTFLSYVGEPVQVERKNLGYYVLGFLVLLIIVTFLLKREYWKDIK